MNALEPARPLPDNVASSEARARDQNAKPIRIALFGLFGTGNFGNDASLEVMLTFLRERLPNAHISCICGNPPAVEKDFGIRAVRINYRPTRDWLVRLNRAFADIPREIKSFVRSIAELRRVDFIIVPGTGILDDFGTGPRGMPYALFRWCLLARIMRKKLLFVSIGAGPIIHPISRYLMKSAARWADYRSYRDDVSRDYMKMIGLDVTDDTVVPDIAFDLPSPSTSENRTRRIIAIGLMSYNGWHDNTATNTDIYDRYLENISEFAHFLLAENYTVRILSGDEYDQKAIEALLKKLPEAAVTGPDAAVIAEPAHSIHDVLDQVAGSDAVIASRYHNIVAALIANKPTMSIGYAAKNDALLAQMGLTEYCQHIENIDVDLLINQFQNLMKNSEIIRQQIQSRRKIFRECLKQQQNRLLQIIRPPEKNHDQAAAPPETMKNQLVGPLPPPTPMRFSVVVSTLGRTTEVGRIIDSLPSDGLEVIIVDQNDDDRLQPIISECHSQRLLKRIRTPGARGLSRGRNRGWRESCGQYVVFADDDCWYPAGLFDRVAQVFKETGADIVCGRATDDSGRSINGRYETAKQWIDRSNVWTTSIEWMVFFRRDILEPLNGYDEMIGVGAASPWQAAEGQDILLRALSKGYRCFFDPEICGHHVELDTAHPNQNMRHKALGYARGMGFVLRRHRFGITGLAKWVGRPAGAALLYTLKRQPQRALYYVSVARGRLEGFLGYPT
jgi:polysaccharide pyruvyl transferase WcaK-like protein